MRMKSILDTAAFQSEPISEHEADTLILEAEILPSQLHHVAQP